MTYFRRLVNYVLLEYIHCPRTRTHSPYQLLLLTSEFFNKSTRLLEKAMAPHSSTLAWKIPWTEEPDGLQSMGSLRVGHD